MASTTDRRPRPADVLYENLYQLPTAEQRFQLLSEGLLACCDNAERLLADAEYLQHANRFCIAWFLITTAREEMAKSYILLDACALDFAKHGSELRALCGAFYNHIAKHAYVEVQKFPGLASMCEVMEVWKAEVKRWWPTEPESGEPSMPHNTYFNRELPLYVDFDDYAGVWSIPDNDLQGTRFIPILDTTPISRAQKMLSALKHAKQKGLLAPHCLRAINEVFSSRYIGDGTTWQALQRVYEQAAQKIAKDVGVPAPSFLESTLVRWPLYHCVVQGC